MQPVSAVLALALRFQHLVCLRLVRRCTGRHEVVDGVFCLSVPSRDLLAEGHRLFEGLFAGKRELRHVLWIGCNSSIDRLVVCANLRFLVLALCDLNGGAGVGYDIGLVLGQIAAEEVLFDR